MANNQEVYVLGSLQRAMDWLTHTRLADPTRAWRGRLAAVLLLLIGLFTLIAIVAGIRLVPVTGAPGSPIVATRIINAGLFALWLVLYLANRYLDPATAGVGLAVCLLGLALASLTATGPLAAYAIMLIVPVVVAGLFGPPISAVTIALAAGLAYLALNLLADPAYFRVLFSSGPAAQTLAVYLNLAFVAVIAWLFSRNSHQALVESQQTSLALVVQREQLAEQLTKQMRQLQATVTVARAVVGKRSLDDLLRDAARLVRDTYGLHQVQMFLTDREQGYSVLRQSTGEVGQALVARGHRLAIGSLSVIGQVTATGHPLLVRDSDLDPVHRRNELLPHSRSEMVLPLTVGSDVIGVLDLQSEHIDGFKTEDFPTYQALADLLAIAVHNAHLFEEAEENLRELRQLSRETTQRSWAEFLAETREEDRQQVYGPERRDLQVQRSRIIDHVLSVGSVIMSSGKDGESTFLAAPIVVRNEVVGILAVESDEPRDWTQEDLRLIEAIASRTALAVENARLYIQAQRAAERERMVNAIASRLQRAPSLSMLLESATRELAEALGTDNVYAEINLEQPIGHRRKPASDSETEVEESSETPDTVQDASPAGPDDEPEGARAEL